MNKIVIVVIAATIFASVFVATSRVEAAGSITLNNQPIYDVVAYLPTLQDPDIFYKYGVVKTIDNSDKLISANITIDGDDDVRVDYTSYMQPITDVLVSYRNVDVQYVPVSEVAKFRNDPTIKFEGGEVNDAYFYIQKVSGGGYEQFDLRTFARTHDYVDTIYGDKITTIELSKDHAGNYVVNCFIGSNQVERLIFGSDYMSTIKVKPLLSSPF